MQDGHADVFGDAAKEAHSVARHLATNVHRCTADRVSDNSHMLDAECIQQIDRLADPEVVAKGEFRVAL
jgi:hypothetical protein